MKLKKIYKTLMFSCIFFLGVGCNEKLEGLNVDPNEPTQVPAANLVTQAMYSISDLYWSRNLNFEYGMLLVQHFAQDEYTDEQRYNFTAADFDLEWTVIYAGGLADLNEARRLVEEDESLSDSQQANRLAVIDIMMAFGFQMATDIWGDIPYSQALQPSEYIQPMYDSQAEIYSSLIVSVTNAVKSIDASEAGFSSSEDIIYSGDMSGWQKFGNALLLRMGMRLADSNTDLARSTVSAALGGNIISSVNDEASLIFSSLQDLANPFWFDASAAGGSRDDFRITEILVDQLQSSDDPRLTVYADSTSLGTYVGMPYGLNDVDAFALKNSTSRYGAIIREATAPAFLLRYSEVKFLEAEAVERGFITGDAEAAFQEGVTASMNEWGISDATAINSYLVANPYDAANWDESIGLQMWLALYTNGLEAWATWRRLDQPILPVPDEALLPSIPVRGLYPTDEAATNLSNMLNVPYDDLLTTGLWWDVN